MIYLASKSPRRRDLLKQLGVAFEELRLREAPGRTRDVVEESLNGEPAAHYVERIARTKASVGWKRMEQRGLIPYPVLGADTEVVQGDEIFGKPRDAAHAAEMLRRLSGRQHDVLSGVALKRGDEILFALSVTHVTFRHALRRGDRALRRHRRAAGQGRRLRDPGPRRCLRDTPRRKLLRRHGIAAFRDRRPAREGRRSRAIKPSIHGFDTPESWGQTPISDAPRGVARRRFDGQSGSDPSFQRLPMHRTHPPRWPMRSSST